MLRTHKMGKLGELCRVWARVLGSGLVLFEVVYLLCLCSISPLPQLLVLNLGWAKHRENTPPPSNHQPRVVPSPAIAARLFSLHRMGWLEFRGWGFIVGVSATLSTSSNATVAGWRRSILAHSYFSLCVARIWGWGSSCRRSWAREKGRWEGSGLGVWEPRNETHPFVSFISYSFCFIFAIIINIY